MHKLQKAAVVVVALGSVGLMSAGTATAQGLDGHGGKKGGDKVSVLQSSHCKSHDLNVDVLGQVGILNGVLGNALNGEGNSGGQDTHIGSSMGCDNSAF
ncbi:hypothetical protein J7F01_04215 [Streptomyces sp. ISL-22]|uniref:Secreted protein n=1 Tax=Streptomyces curacoi TaxID=146536 RepID=A0A117PEZ6_9ACTN|nr:MULTISPECIES: hypothetical protein [Streptomyces]KUM78381.1 hypothetical protein AQI70_12965 [Streptomyces curacoi]MBT2418796.1 hypothetical protein [Streptomyces sp. ISL-24]MBT2431421.1 hypothetical protein [Streptomyces sp. ISL-22]